MEPLKKVLSGNVKSNKRRISEEEEGAQQPKLPRTMQDSSLIKPSAEQATHGVYASSSQSQLPLHTSDRASLKSPPNRTASGSSTASPIDLTDVSSSSIAASDGLFRGFGHSSMIMESDSSKGHSKGKQAQILRDEEVARALQEEFDRGFREPDVAAGSHAPTGHGDFDFQAYGHQISTLKCGKCKSKLNLNGQEVMLRVKAMTHKSGPHSFMQCSQCRVHSCAGCGRYRHNISQLRSLDASDYTKSAIVPYCCDKGRMFLVFALLCGPELVSVEAPPASPGLRGRLRIRTKTKSEAGTSSTPSLPDKPKMPVAKPPKQPKPNDSQLSKGTGYGGDATPLQRLMGIQSPPHRPPSKNYSELDLERYFKYLGLLLPDANHPHRTSFDVDRRKDILSMIVRSPLMPIALELLRNQNMEEIGAKYSLYDALVSFLDRISCHTDTAVSLISAQTSYPLHEQLLHATFPRASTEQGAGPVETRESIVKALEELKTSCEFYSNKASVHKQHFQEGQSIRLVQLAVRVCTLAGTLSEVRADLRAQSQQSGFVREAAASNTKAPVATSSVMTRSRSIKDAALRENMAKEKAKEEADAWNRDHMLEEVPDDQLLDSFYFASRARNLTGTTQAKGRMRKLISQLAILRNSLPLGIYIRHGSSRVDVMKVLFIGPEDSPYENGLFEFDVFCGESFPQKPPEVQFRTTGAGRAAFNPNLYNNGKVCLSLLGTWTGPGWNPEESTILQILVSIQAMIFTDKPWYNEPGREAHLNENLSLRYNREIQKLTVQHAMTYWLQERLNNPGKGKLSGVEKPAAATSVVKPMIADLAVFPKLPLVPAPPVPKANGVSAMNTAKGQTLTPGAVAAPLGSVTGIPNAVAVHKHSGATTSSAKINGVGLKKTTQDQVPSPSSTPSMFANTPAGLKYYVPPGANPLPNGTAQGQVPIPGSSTTPGMPIHAPGSHKLKLLPVPQSSVALMTNGPPFPSGDPFLIAAQGSQPSQSSTQGTIQDEDGPPTFQKLGYLPGWPPPPQPGSSHHLLGVGSMPTWLNAHLDLMEEEDFDMSLPTTTPPDMDMQHMWQPDIKKPIGNTAVDSKDDNVWGEVIRHHFSTRSTAIVQRVRQWKTGWIGAGTQAEGAKVVDELLDALGEHGFVN